MRIGIFEMDHYEGAYPVIKLFDTPANNITVFTNTATHGRFTDLFRERSNSYQWVVLSGNRWRFFWQLYRAIKKQQLDLFYINTISNNHLLYAAVIALLGKLRVIITIHDINCMFESKPSADIRIMAHHLGKKLLIKLVKEFNVVSDTMVPYLRQKTASKKMVHNVPGAVFDGAPHRLAAGETIHLVIPGSIDKKRRHYETVLELARAAEEKQLPLRITVLGGYYDEYGKDIVQRIRSFPARYTTLHSYDTDVVHQDEFDLQLNQAHFIFIPSVINTAICHGIPEIYGITKSSGNIFDVIKHAKPFIAPQALTVPDNLKSSCFRYAEVKDIIDFLATLLKEKHQYTAWEDNAIHNSGLYTIEKVRTTNATLFP